MKESNSNSNDLKSRNLLNGMINGGLKVNTTSNNNSVFNTHEAENQTAIAASEFGRQSTTEDEKLDEGLIKNKRM